MRNEPRARLDKEESRNSSFHVDWRENPAEVMEAVDKELKQYGLEVVSHESDGDFYAFSILPIKE